MELVYNLQKEGKRVHTNDVANSLGITPASVTEVFHKLSEEGYINYEKYGGVTLTDKGKKVARETQKRHDALKEFLLLLGVNQDVAEKDACEMEHILHTSTMDMIVKFVEVIRHCKVTPFWLERLKEYVRTGDLTECPPELAEVCLKYSKKSE